ncbi:hypothetical protein [Andreprevotia chitinilytica]|uniref:hypothetical protein n=1 Tax=Andreprevotia chitinilytica TaxID=396808 RepID=UPI001470177C|nr:hypothetical protein [Andreprevotia chitinilytica]
MWALFHCRLITRMEQKCGAKENPTNVSWSGFCIWWKQREVTRLFSGFFNALIFCIIKFSEEIVTFQSRLLGACMPYAYGNASIGHVGHADRHNVPEPHSD